MALANYVDLQASVAAWAARGDVAVTGRIPDFIRLGEERIWRKVRLSDGIAAIALTIAAGYNFALLPTDFLGFKRLRLDTGRTLEYMSPDQIEALPSNGNSLAYSIEAGRLIYGQSASADATVYGAYYQHPGYIEAVSSTWLLTKYPSIYLYASLLEAALFVKNLAKVAEWGTLLDKAIAEAKSADDAMQISGSRLRVAGRL